MQVFNHFLAVKCKNKKWHVIILYTCHLSYVMYINKGEKIWTKINLQDNCTKTSFMTR
jgi:hypothetical protein